MNVTHFCLNENIPQRELCPPGFVIRVITTEVGYSGGGCVVQDNDCRILSERAIGNFIFILSDLREYCEFKQSCQSFNLGFGIVMECESLIEITDYGTMTYRCEQGEIFFVFICVESK